MTLPNNTESLRQFLMPKIKIITETILDGIASWNRREISRKVYDAGTPSLYERTYNGSTDWEHDPEDGSFMSAWSGEVEQTERNEMTADFEYDPTKLIAEQIGVHTSALDDSDIREYLAEIIYEGLAGHIFGEGFWTQKRDAWNALLRIVGGQHMKIWIEQGAKKAGLKISW